MAQQQTEPQTETAAQDGADDLATLRAVVLALAGTRASSYGCPTTCTCSSCQPIPRNCSPPSTCGR
jgi:hypothetical protein